MDLKTFAQSYIYGLHCNIVRYVFVFNPTHYMGLEEISFRDSSKRRGVLFLSSFHPLSIYFRSIRKISACLLLIRNIPRSPSIIF